MAGGCSVRALHLSGNRPSEQTGAVMGCERCQGNGEIVLNWDRYLCAHEGDTGNEAVAECPDCDGTGEATPTV